MEFKIQFSAPISHQGDMLLIVIPKRLHQKIKKQAESKEHYLITIENL